MRILFVVHGYPPEGAGGTEIHAATVAKALSARHEVAVFTRTADRQGDEHSQTRDTVDGIPVLRVRYRFGDVAAFGDIFVNARIEAAFDRELDRFRPDVVHVHHLTGLSTTIPSRARLRGIPTVLTLHDFWLGCPRGQRITEDLSLCRTLDRSRCLPCLTALWPHLLGGATLRGRLRTLLGGGEGGPLRDYDARIRALLSGIDAFVTPSRFHRDRYVEQGVDLRRVRVIPHGLPGPAGPPRSLRPVRAVGYIGTVFPSKGVHVLLEAMNRLGRPDIALRIHGEAPSFHGDTGYLDRLRRLAGPGLHVEFTGRYDHAAVPDLLAALDILVVPSLWWETFGLTIREGLLSGLPVVASDIGAFREALEDGSGLLFRPGDPDDLATVLRRLIEDPSERARFLNRGDAVRSVEENVADLESVYAAVLRGGAQVSAPREAAPRPVPDPDLVARRVARGIPESPRVTVFIPAWNGADTIEDVLRMVLSQKTDFDFEISVIDSGSRDGTLDVLARYPVRLARIPNEEFDHGLTRNRGIREARGDIVVLLTQDAVPLDDRWLSRLVGVFDDPAVVGAYCHQVPRPDCSPWIRDRLRGWTRGDGVPEIRTLPPEVAFESLSPGERLRLVAFDDVASAVRRSVALRIPFPRRRFGEDIAWGRAAILAGGALAMVPGAVVMHSNNRSIWYEFRRIILDHRNLHDLVGLHQVPTLRHVFVFSAHATLRLSGVVLRSDLPLSARIGALLRTPWFAFTQNLGQYLGARENLREQAGRRPSRLLRRITGGV